MNPRVVNGWIVVDCDAPDTSKVYIGTDADRRMKAAFRDYEDGVRVAKIRVPARATGRVRVILEVNYQRTELGVISL